MPTTPERFDLAVVGAGIVGLATARALARGGGLSVAVLEAEERVGAHQTGHNSGVLHSGLYYRPGSLRAELCTRGREELARYCQERALPFERCGKIVVATEERELAALAELERRGRANGLALERLDADGIRAREPHVRGIAGLFVPETGVVDFGAVARALAGDLVELGAELRLAEPVGRLRRAGGEWTLQTPRGELRARALITCAGVQADRVARRAGCRPPVRIVPFRGEYARLVPAARHVVRALVYPVPDARYPFLGVHFTRGVDGEVEVGPNAVLALARNGYRRGSASARDLVELARFRGFWRFAARHWRTGAAEWWRSLSRAALARAARRLVPELEARDLVPAGAGVRAQALEPDGSLADDFRFASTEGALHVLSAPSPAASASLAIGDPRAAPAAAELGLARAL